MKTTAHEPHYYDYFKVLECSKLLNLLLELISLSKPGLFGTLDPTYHEEVRVAECRLREYFRGATKDTPPLNCLILGPPGAGKTFLAESLANAVDLKSEEVNVSLMNDARKLLKRIQQEEPALRILEWIHERALSAPTPHPDWV